MFKRKKGFTLVELIVVIAIVGILSVVLIPAITGYVKDAKESADEQEARAIYNIYINYQLEKEFLEEKNFIEYYKEITGEDLVDEEDPHFWFCARTSDNYTKIWPCEGSLPGEGSLPDNLMDLTDVFVCKGHYYSVIDIETGEIETGYKNISGPGWTE